MDNARKILLFLIVFLLFYLFSLCFFGETGYFVNKSIKNEINRINKIISKNDIEIESIESEIESADDFENLNDIAFSLGYKSEDSQVYYFDHEDILDINYINEETVDASNLYKGIPSYLLAIGALIFTVVIFVILRLFKKKERKKDIYIGGGYNDYSDY